MDGVARVWLGFKGPEVSSLSECHCRLFDDSGLGHALDAGHGVYGAETDANLRDLGKVLRRMDDLRAPHLHFEGPDLVTARLMATTLLHDIELIDRRPEQRPLRVVGPDSDENAVATIATRPPWSLRLAFADGTITGAQEGDLFAALQSVRTQLERSGRLVCCLGARPDVALSGMSPPDERRQEGLPPAPWTEADERRSGRHL